MKEVLTAGGTVYDSGKILLIRHKGGGLSFAKGHIEGNETPEETAIREVAEETGYETSIMSYIGSLKRKSQEKDGEPVSKRIRLYRMALISRLDRNTDEAPVWIEPEKALRGMQFQEEAIFLEQHLELLR